MDQPREPYQTQGVRTISNVSLICTVYNESKTIRDFLESITQLTVLPSEIVIVDGGSKDDTVNLIREFLRKTTLENIVKIIVDPSCNLSSSPSPVARGRNVAIRNSTREIIACTDAGCIIEKNWLEKIVAPFSESSSVDVVSGWYLADVHTFFQRCLSIIYLIAPESVDSERVLPSSRSIAFKKSAWARVGGYPERGLWGEDSAYGIQLRRAGCKFVYVPDAIVYWRIEFTLFSFIKSQYQYGFGDGFHSILVLNVF
ncbi:MAG TPA: glycosyltransferase, partial [Bacteroidota bacterium]|nr:glycosyltransferase [Bacteroidota bacterium]